MHGREEHEETHTRVKIGKLVGAGRAKNEYKFHFDPGPSRPRTSTTTPQPNTPSPPIDDRKTDDVFLFFPRHVLWFFVEIKMLS